MWLGAGRKGYESREPSSGLGGWGEVDRRFLRFEALDLLSDRALALWSAADDRLFLALYRLYARSYVVVDLLMVLEDL